MSPAVSERVVSVRDGMFEVRVREAGAGRPLLYLHGAEGPLEGWPAFLAKLAERYHVVAPDLPGTGGSSGGEHLYDILDLTIYHLDLLDALGLERPSVIGHDLGGMAAAELAAVAGERLGRLVLVAPLGLWQDDAPVLDVFATPPDRLAPLAWHDPSGEAAVAVLAPRRDEEAGHLASLERTRNLATATRFLWPIPDRGLKKRLHRVRQPTLLVWGASDRVVPPSYGDAFARLLPDARLVTISAAGHLPMLEQPARFVEEVEAFLGP